MPANVLIYNTQGQILKNISLTDASKVDIMIDSPGVHFIKFVKDDGEMISKKVIIVE